MIRILGQACCSGGGRAPRRKQHLKPAVEAVKPAIAAQVVAVRRGGRFPIGYMEALDRGFC